MAVILALALIAIAFEIYSDAALTSAEVSHTAAPDPVTAAVAHALRRGYPTTRLRTEFKLVGLVSLIPSLQAARARS
jgi:hypothetical protein